MAESIHDELDRAITLAIVAHQGQLDKIGQPYILHPLRVMLKVPAKARVAAVLHDAIEDSTLTTAALLRAGIGYDSVQAVHLLTRNEKLFPGDQYYTKIRANSIALMVKLADIEDNSDPKRTAWLDDLTRARLAAKYAHALEVLNG